MEAPTKQDKLKKIYEVIADKTYSKWYMYNLWWDILVSYAEDILWDICIMQDKYREEKKPYRVDLLWHPVMINICDWYFKKHNRPDLCIQLDIDDLCKCVDERSDEKITQLYDNLLILWCK